MKKVIISISAILALLVIMYAEYRYIMVHQCPYYDGNDTIYIEVFGQIDEYDAESISELE